MRYILQVNVEQIERFFYGGCLLDTGEPAGAVLEYTWVTRCDDGSRTVSFVFFDNERPAPGGEWIEFKRVTLTETMHSLAMSVHVSPEIRDQIRDEFEARRVGYEVARGECTRPRREMMATPKSELVSQLDTLLACVSDIDACEAAMADLNVKISRLRQRKDELTRANGWPLVLGEPQYVKVKDKLYKVYRVDPASPSEWARVIVEPITFVDGDAQ